MLIVSTRIDAAAALDGAWIDDLSGFGDFKVLTRAFDSPKAEVFRQQLYRQILGVGRSRREKLLPPELRDYVEARCMAEICVLGWDNYQDYDRDETGAVRTGPDGEPVVVAVPFSRARLEQDLLVDAPKGVRAGGRSYATPDGRAFNYAMKPFLDALIGASLRVSAPADDDVDDAGGSDAAGEDAGGKN